MSQDVTAIPGAIPNGAAAPSLRFLMHLHAPLAAPASVNDQYLVFSPRKGGYVSGPEVKGRIVPPSGDWVRILASGDLRIDAKLLIETDNGHTLFMGYEGVLAAPDPDSWLSFMQGTKIEAPAWRYVVAPKFETGSPALAWLNGVQAIGKFVSIQVGEHAHVAFDIYAVD